MIRDAIVSDAEQIQYLINAAAQNGKMLYVSMNDVFERLLEFIVYMQDGNIVGACSLHPTWGDVAEIRSLVVSPNAQNNGIGREMVQYQLDRAKKRGFKKIFTLTYRDSFFEKLGFKIINIDSLPKKIWTDCLKCVKYPHCDEIAMEIII